MSTLCWNCRGLGNPRTVRELIDLVYIKKPDFIFLMETKVGRIHAECVRIKLGFEGLFYVDNVGLSGGLALFWRTNNTAKLLSFSKNHIDVEVSLTGYGVWRMTGFYGFPERGRRSESWDLLRSLAGRSPLPWVVLGDFNDLLFQYEKRGGNPHPDSLLRGFGEAVADCGLSQLSMHGHPFTWQRGKGTTDWLEERLDKVLAREDWCDALPCATVTNILTRTSDHSALYLGIKDVRPRHHRARRRFRFEMAWLHDEGCRHQVEGAWEEGRDGGFLRRLEHCGDRLLRWSGDRFHKFGERIKSLRKEQLHLQGAVDPLSLAEYQRIEAQYASARRKKNMLFRLKNDSSLWVENEGLFSLVLNYFEDIFTSNNSSPPTDYFFESVTPRVSQSQNENLLRPFEAEEVKAALFSMFPDKAPGPDGMNPGFYQHFWDVVGEDVTSFVLNCLSTCSFPEGLNDTNVVLIPKKCVPQMVTDLCPIALCNVVYKFMAKMIANRMKPLLGDVISESQSAFIPDRLITDNILIAAEMGHYLNRNQNGVVGWGALKLDMAKAYDRMEWSFLRRMLLALGFADDWVKLIMLCVSSVSYNFQVNGEIIGQVSPTQGIRQGDPLSPYLFIICAEGLSLLLQQAESRGSFHGCRVARGAPSVSHLLFADDSLLFFKANAQEAGVIKQCLNKYEAMSGQAVNFHKSSVCFSRNTSVADREEVAAVLGVNQAPNFGKYLGLPSFVGRNKKVVFSYIEDKIRHRIGSWNKRLLSRAGKEVLLKSVAQSMPTFCMSVFLLPESVCLSIERVMNRYWWGSGGDRGIHWNAWDRLCVPKKYGGLGFKELRAFNLAMLGKQVWRFLTNPHSLVARIYKARYFPKSSFIDASVGGCPSYCWRSIMAAHDLVCSGVRRRIGNGKSTLIWGHPWLPDDPGPMVQTVMPQTLAGAAVSGLIDPTTNTWDQTILHDIFTLNDVRRILSIPFLAAVAVLYFIWTARNKAVWDACLPTPRRVWQMATSAADAWRQVHQHMPGPSTPDGVEAGATLSAAVHQGDMLHRCFFDAGFLPKSRKASVGVVLLSPEGDFVAAFNSPMQDCLSPLMAESVACKEVLSWIKDRGLGSVVHFTDCSGLQQLLTSVRNDILSYVAFSVNASKLIMSTFDHCSVRTVSRSANLAAHSLASLAFSQPNALYWDVFPPDSISSLI
ncbi:uncharacterized protein LOC116004082 [Ipomoea triloba]|uniref:uncharacterized protein LOC116004082 n=1 Tax=Ipomoea triloba TaxID=35885 RepID=UPI00125D11B3|nr:uncharacterized protein LOC116004082 [Ipomoea triloba]